MRRHLRLALFLTLLWMLLFGRFELLYFIVGAVVGAISIQLSQPVVGAWFDEKMYSRYRFKYLQGPVDLAQRTWAFALLLVYYLYEVAKTNLMMTRDVLVPHPELELGIFAMPVRGLGPVETTALSNMIGLTPGTTVLDYDQVRETIYVQTIYAHDVDSMRDDLYAFARLICRVTGCQLPEPWPEAR